VYRGHALGILSEAAYGRANMQLAQERDPEAGPLGPPEFPSLFGSAQQLPAEHGITVEQLAAAARLPLERVQHVLRAGSDTRLRLQVPPT